MPSLPLVQQPSKSFKRQWRLAFRKSPVSAKPLKDDADDTTNMSDEFSLSTHNSEDNLSFLRAAAKQSNKRVTNKQSIKAKSLSRKNITKQCPLLVIREPIVLKSAMKKGVTTSANKTVSFSLESNLVREIERISDLVSNPQALWYQSNEYNDIKSEVSAIVDQIDIKECEANGVCMRGLEDLTKVGDARREKRRQESILTVLVEQQIQYETNEYDDERLALQYELTSLQTVMEAARRAAEDAAEVDSYLRSARRELRRRGRMA